jgi:membrane-associated protein
VGSTGFEQVSKGEFREVVEEGARWCIRRGLGWPEDLERTEAFYAQHGGKTVILARFIPIIRTIAPFVAGAGNMHYLRYLMFCVIGAILWVVSLSMLGYHFGNLEIVKNNFEIAILSIIFISVFPLFIHCFKVKYLKS